jgi:hypothetical protein
MDYVRVVETTENVEDSVSFADVGKEFVAKTFAFRCTFYETCDIDDFDSSWYYALRVDEFSEFI